MTFLSVKRSYLLKPGEVEKRVDMEQRAEEQAKKARGKVEEGKEKKG